MYIIHTVYTPYIRTYVWMLIDATYCHSRSKSIICKLKYSSDMLDIVFIVSRILIAFSENTVVYLQHMCLVSNN